MQTLAAIGLLLCNTEISSSIGSGYLLFARAEAGTCGVAHAAAHRGSQS